MNKFHCVAIFLFFTISFIDITAQNSLSSNYSKFVNPYIGSDGHGHVFVGANVPFGAIQLGPNNIQQTWDKFNGWDWCSGYNYVSKEIIGFAHTHLSGTGIGDLNDILILPANGKIQLQQASFGDMNTGYGSNFSHNNEKVKPGYYSVYLDKYKIKAELTATERVGFHQYHFDKKDNAHLLLDLSYAICWDSTVTANFTKLNDTTFVGYRYSTGWAKDQRIYFAITLSQPVTNFLIYNNSILQNSKQATGQQIKAALVFNASIKDNIKIKVGISPVSIENAIANIKAEIPGWDFKKIVKAADKKWNDALGKIHISAPDSVKSVFYTSLYHSYFFPSLYNDHNNDYLGTDKKVYRNSTFDNYSVFSLWDTYRGVHPLMTLIQPQRINDYVNTFLAIYKQQGKLPVWHLMGNETNTMIGYPAVPVIVDAYLKGFREYDVALAYEAVKQSAMQQTDGINYVQQLQFIPADSVGESVAKALEYAISDWGIAQMAKSLHKQIDYEYFSKRAKLYAEYFDKTTQHMRGRVSEHLWRNPFNPFSAVHRENDYCEGNAWQYTWLVPHAVEGLINLLGGDKPFLQKLDSLFSLPSALGENASPDISGMIGQYAHGNEPNHHIPYLYAYAGQPWKTAKLIRTITDTFYLNKPNGLCGNDDVGEMSTWYVFSALGFYPVNPQNGSFVFGSPLINNAVINTGSKKFSIQVVNNSKTSIYIQKILLNGKKYPFSFIKYSDIVAGGKIVIYMGSKPAKNWGVAIENRPVSDLMN